MNKETLTELAKDRRNKINLLLNAVHELSMIRAKLMSSDIRDLKALLDVNTAEDAAMYMDIFTQAAEQIKATQENDTKPWRITQPINNTTL